MSQLLKLETAPDLVDQVYRVLLDAISDGSLAPGARITQEEIAEQLSVSRQPVLQALRLLKKDGFVLDAPGRGVLVAPIDAESIAQVYQIRGAMDALAARLACANRAAFDHTLFDALIAKGRKAASQATGGNGKLIRALIDADIAFHDAIYKASGNPMIEQSAHLHWRHIRRAMGAVLQQSVVRDFVWDEHAAIAEAIVAGRADTAEKLMKQHSAEAGRFLTEQLARQNHTAAHP